MNEELAKNCKAIYTPAVARGEIFRRNNRILLEKISAIVEDAAKSLEPISLGLPSVASALVARSRGNPTALILEALQLRELANDLRHLLSNKLGKHEIETPDWHHELRIQLKDLSSTLEKELHSLFP